jgi:hypothetical protein
VTDPDDRDSIDLDRWTPAGKTTLDYAIELLRSTHPAEIHGAERWLLDHPETARRGLVNALATPSAQAAAVLLGLIGDRESIPFLVQAHDRGGEGLRSAVRTGLATLLERGVTEAGVAIGALDGGHGRS